MKKRKILTLLFGIMILSSLVLLGNNVYQKIKHKSVVIKNIQQVPAFSFETIDGQLFTHRNLVNKSKIFIYFNSECEYCQSEAEQFAAHIEKLKDVQLIFVSSETSKRITEFAKTYGLLHHSNILFLSDPEHHFTRLFNVNIVPFMAVYDAKNKLITTYKGATKVETVLQELSVRELLKEL